MTAIKKGKEHIYENFFTIYGSDDGDDPFKTESEAVNSAQDAVSGNEGVEYSAVYKLVKVYKRRSGFEEIKV